MKRCKKWKTKDYLCSYICPYFRGKCKNYLSGKRFQLSFQLTARQNVDNSRKITSELHSRYKSKSHLSWMIRRVNLWHPPWQSHQDTTNAASVMTVERWQNAEKPIRHCKMMHTASAVPSPSSQESRIPHHNIAFKIIRSEKSQTHTTLFLTASFLRGH